MEPKSRTLWLRTEPLHAVIYFDEECRRMGKALGLKGFWMGYFAARTAPMGPVCPGAATAALAVFAPGMVARALPSAWRTVTPEQVTDARARYAAQALRRAIPDIDDHAARLSAPLTAMVEDAPALARPLFAANRPLCDRDDPVERLWQLTTALREFRGDAHAAALADHGLDAPEALALAAATGRVPSDSIRLDRGWSETEWAAALDRLRSRGLLDAQAQATSQGRQERDRIEDTTDRLAARLLQPLRDHEADTLLTALEAPARHLLDANVLPFPNPIGLPRPA
ncbi:SCO6745 family protein [Streptomyces sp. 8N616]|uniref:SCO6745 family protein n=1 Tax=Streptomyces sp. 8N616 TaxID=3457414 RepID=UPI003FD51B73